MPRAAELLERDLARSRAMRRRVGWLGVVGAMTLLACIAGGAAGMVTFSVIAIFGITVAGGLWITQSHIDDFASQLCRARSPANGGLRTAPRRDRSSAV